MTKLSETDTTGKLQDNRTTFANYVTIKKKLEPLVHMPSIQRIMKPVPWWNMDGQRLPNNTCQCHVHTGCD